MRYLYRRKQVDKTRLYKKERGDTADLPSTKDSSSEEEESEADHDEGGSNDDLNYYEASEADESSKSFF